MKHGFMVQKQINGIRFGVDNSASCSSCVVHKEELSPFIYCKKCPNHRALRLQAMKDKKAVYIIIDGIVHKGKLGFNNVIKL